MNRFFIPFFYVLIRVSLKHSPFLCCAWNQSNPPGSKDGSGYLWHYKLMEWWKNSVYWSWCLDAYASKLNLPCSCVTFRYIKITSRWDKTIFYQATVMVQWVRTSASQAEGWVFELQPRQTLAVKTGSYSSTVKRSTLSASITGPRRLPLWTDIPCHRKCGTLKNPQYSMATSA